MRKLEDQRQIGNDGSSIDTDLLIVAGIVVLIIVICASIHVLLRFFSRKSSSSPGFNAAAASSPPLPSTIRENDKIEDDEDKDLIDSLPLFTLASALSSAPKSSPDCAVCLSEFKLHDQLRLLPSCRHAFHASCVDTWLRSSRSCPLCRASIVEESPPSVPAESERSRSFRVEIGSVSRRREAQDDPLVSQPLSYSIGSSFQYVVEDEVEAVISSVSGNSQEQRRSRGWIMEYMDRLVLSASSSFSSLRFAGCGSRRIDVAETSRSWRWDQRQENEDDPGSSFVRWLVGS
ncbi:TOXICOS EN LEVADURA 4 [Wolffia australiana]